MKLMHREEPGQRFGSDIYNKIWRLSIVPNGMNRKYMDFVDIQVCVCSFLMEYAKLYIKWKMQFVEMSGSIEREVKLNVGRCNDPWAMARYWRLEK